MCAGPWEVEVGYVAVGHSFVHWAEKYAAKQIYGCSLGLPSSRHDVLCWGKSGMRWGNLQPFLTFILPNWGYSDSLVLHLGQNDLVRLLGLTLLQHIQQDLGGHSDPGRRRKPAAWLGPPEYRCAVKRPLRLFWVSRWAGGRPPEGRPPAQRETPFHVDAGSEWSWRSGRGATGAVAPVVIFSVCMADTENLGGALLRGPHNTPCRHPLPGGQNRQEQDGGMGVGIPMAAQQAAPPWRIPQGSGEPAVYRRFSVSDRSCTAAVRMPKGAPPACWRCSGGRWPWRILPPGSE
ncbi:hypothetical protein NDU88_004203 [Pleurodeles waltl]|uniref:Uncharacterized protein n=1 Tax=Pleurodeles waltl TaxID=8319 RepID=A0AAV7UIL5_PLEWA|nr:hypothetical protein NDU88_004203 [Pleurodeles waltl]